VRGGAFTGGALPDATQVLSVIMPFAAIFIISALLALLIAVFVIDFVLPIMYKKKIGILKAWGVFFGLLKRNISEIAKYILVKIGLFIISIGLSIVLMIMALIAILAVGGLFVLVGWLIYSIIPEVSKVAALGVFAIFAIPAFMFLGLLVNAIFIPVPVFFRTFSIHVLGSMDESLDLFAPKAPEEIAAEGDDAQYRKPMRLVWFTILMPLITAITAFSLAIAIPNFLKAGQWGSGAGFPDIREIFSTEKKKTRPGIPVIEKLLPEKTVKVYLTNGNSFEAEIESEVGDSVTLKVEGGTIILHRDDILRIEKKGGKK